MDLDAEKIVIEREEIIEDQAAKLLKQATKYVTICIFINSNKPHIPAVKYKNNIVNIISINFE